MHIQFSPMRRDGRPSVSVTGDVLIIGEQMFDFAGVPEGATLPKAAVASDWLASDVERIDGEIRLTLILPHGPNAPRETLFPDPVRVDDGAVPLPPFATKEPAA